MSTRDDDRLDALIDRVAHDLTAGGPPANLAGQVRARIAGRDRARWFVAWQPVAAAAALVLTIGLASALWPQRPAEAPIVRNDPAPAPARDGLAARGGPAETDDGPAEAGPDVREEPRTFVAAGVSRPAAVTAVATTDATTDAMPLPGIEPLTVGAIEDPVLVAEMTGRTMPIEIEPLQVAPLDVLTASDAGL